MERNTDEYWMDSKDGIKLFIDNEPNENAQLFTEVESRDVKPNISREPKETSKKDLRIVHLKNLPSGDTHEIIMKLMAENTEFKIYHKFFLTRKVLNGSRVIKDELLLKFDSPDDARSVANSLNRLPFMNCLLKAELKPVDFVGGVNKEPEEEFTSDFIDDQGCVYSCTKPSTTGWKVENPKRRPAWNTKRTEQTFGVIPSVLKELGVNKYLSPTIMVKNIHNDVTESKLYEVFSMAGKICQIKVIKKFDPRRATIEYDHPVEALQAISMFNKQKLYGLEMDVSLHVDNPHPRPMPAGLESIGKGFGFNGRPLKHLHTYIEIQKINEILHQMGQVDKLVTDNHPFGCRYKPKSGNTTIFDIHGVATQKNKSKETKPSITTVIEAFGTVLVALDMIPPGTDCKDLSSIVDALQKNHKVISHNKKNKPNFAKKNKPWGSQQVYNHGPQGNADALFKAFCTSLSNISVNPLQLINTGGNLQGNATNANTTNAPNFFSNYQGPSNPIVNPNVPNFSMRVSGSVLPNAVQNPVNNGVISNQPEPPPPPAWDYPELEEMSSRNISQPNTHWKQVRKNPESADISGNPLSQQKPALKRRWDNPNRLDISTNKSDPNNKRPNLTYPQTVSQPSTLNTQSSQMNKLQNQNNAQRSQINSQPSQMNSQPTQMNSQPSQLNSQPSQLNSQPTQVKSQPSRPDHDPRHNTDSKSEDSYSKKELKSELLRFKNLPSRVTIEILSQKLKEVGDLVFAEMTGTGQALARFKTVEGATKCLRAFHHSKVDGQIIEVTPI